MSQYMDNKSGRIINGLAVFGIIIIFVVAALFFLPSISFANTLTAEPLMVGVLDDEMLNIINDEIMQEANSRESVIAFKEKYQTVREDVDNEVYHWKYSLQRQNMNNGNLLEIIILYPHSKDGSLINSMNQPLTLYCTSELYGYHKIGSSNELEVIENIKTTDCLDDSKLVIDVITADFEVDAGSHGTFDVGYSINGGTIKDIVLDENFPTLIVQIESPGDGMIKLDLPRELMGAEREVGRDGNFFVLVDGIDGRPYLEVVNKDPEYRTLELIFEENSVIEIVGTYSVEKQGESFNFDSYCGEGSKYDGSHSCKPDY